MERSDVWFIAVTCAVLGLIVGAAWVDFWGELNPLKEYQTLIAGLAAVAAAYATINTMHRTDEQQRLRHVEQMEFAREPHRLVKRRVSHTYPAFFENLSDLALEIRAYVAESDRTPEEIDRGMIRLAWRFLQFLRIAMEDESLRQARQFFEPQTETNYHFIVVRQREFAEQDAKAFLDEILKTVPMLDDEETNKFFKLCDVIGDMERPLTALSEDLRILT